MRASQRGELHRLAAYLLNLADDDHVCDQVMDAEHKLHLEGHSDAKSVYQSSKAEAGQIIGLKNDLTAAVESPQQQTCTSKAERDKATTTLNAIIGRIDRGLAPALQATKYRLDSLFDPTFESHLSFKSAASRCD